MGPQDTPPTSPFTEEEIDDNVEIIDAYEVEDDGLEGMEGGEDAMCIFEKHNSAVFCGNLRIDGKFAITGGEDDKAYVWNTETAEVILECGDHKDSVILAAFSYDDKFMATGDMNGFIQVRNTAEMDKIIWDYTMGDATWMQWHPLAHILIGGSVEGEVYMWKVPEGDCKIVQGFGKRAELACLMPDGKKLIVGYEDGIIRIIDLKTSSVVSTIFSNIGHNSAITCIDCHLNNNLILSAACDGKTIISAANTGQVIRVLQDLKGNVIDDQNEEASGFDAKGNWIEAAAFMKDQNQQIAVTGTLSGDIFVWDITRQTLRHKLDQASGISKLVWKESSTLFFTAGLDGIMRCFDARSGECLRTFLGHTDDILDICISKDGKKILTTSDDSSARIFNIESF